MLINYFRFSFHAPTKKTKKQKKLCISFLPSYVAPFQLLHMYESTTVLFKTKVSKEVFILGFSLAYFRIKSAPFGYLSPVV